MQQPKTQSNLRGFTLVEMMIVLIIVGLISTIFISRLPQKPKAKTPAVIRFLEQQRNNSIKLQQTIHIRQYPKHLYATSSQQSYSLIASKNDMEQNFQTDEYKIVTSFFSDGTATANTFYLTEGTITYVITTSPFSNKIHYRLR